MRVAGGDQGRVGDLEEAVIGQRLHPLLAGGRLVLVGDLLAGLPGQRGLPRHVRRPPRVGGDVVDQAAERLDVRREQQHLGHRGQLRLEALLGGLLPEHVEVRRQRDVGVEVAVGPLEQADHRGVVGEPVGVGRRVDQRVAGRLGEERPGGAEGVAVRVVRERAADDLVGVQLGVDPVHHRDEGVAQVVHAEEVHRGPLGLERALARGRVAAQVGVPGLPGHVAADHRRAQGRGLGRDRVDRLGRGGGQQQVHLVRQDGLAGQVAGPVRVGLRVVGLDRDLVGLAADLEAVLVLRRLGDLGHDPVVRRAEAGQRPGERVDKADHDVLGAAAARGRRGTAAGTLDARAAGAEQSAASHDGRADASRAQHAAPADRSPQAPQQRLRTVGLRSLVTHMQSISL